MAVNTIKKATSSAVTLATATNNQVATVTGTDALTGESNLTFDGTTLQVGSGVATPNINGDNLVLNSTGNVGLSILGDTTSSASIIYFGIDGDESDGRIFYQNSATTPFMDFYTAATHQMRIDSNGNVGIGNSSPTSWGTSDERMFVVSNGANSSGANTSNLVLDVTFNTANSAIMFTNGVKAFSSAEGVIQYDHNTNSMRFRSNAAEAMRIASNRNVHIGDAGQYGHGNYAKVASVETSNPAQTSFRGTIENASTSGTMFFADSSRAASSAYNFGLYLSSSGGSSDTEFKLRGDGQAYADGSWNGSGADYQELFESVTGIKAVVGMSVVLDGDKVRYYDSNTDSVDDIIGVTRPTEDNKNSAVVGNTAWNHWTDKYLTDDWGVYLREDITVWTWDEYEDENGKIVKGGSVYEKDMPDDWIPPINAVQSTDNVRKLNPDYDESQHESYLPRVDREEWWLIGLLGQIQIKAGDPTNPRWIKMKDISASVELWFVR
jgi:hypothetical protein